MVFTVPIDMVQVTFPLELDVYDYCNPELQQQLAGPRTAYKDYQDKLAEVALCHLAWPKSCLQAAYQCILLDIVCHITSRVSNGRATAIPQPGGDTRSPTARAGTCHCPLVHMQEKRSAKQLKTADGPRPAPGDAAAASSVAAADVEMKEATDAAAAEAGISTRLVVGAATGQMPVQLSRSKAGSDVAAGAQSPAHCAQHSRRLA